MARDIAVVTVDGDTRDAYRHPVLTSVRRDIDTIARQALDLLLMPVGAMAEPAEEIALHLDTGESRGCPTPPA